MAFLRFRSVYCIPKDDVGIHQRNTFSAVCIVTATLSGYGACVQLKSWYGHLRDRETRRKPSSHPLIMFCLALADLFTCVGVIGMAILLIAMHPPHKINIFVAQYGKNMNMTYPNRTWYKYVGVPIESFTMFSYISSYLWTLAYAVDICLQVHNRDKSIKIKCYVFLCWVSSLWLVFWGQVGYLSGSNKYCSGREQEILHFMVCFIPLVCVFLLLPCIYWTTYRKILRSVKTTAVYTNTERELLFAIRKKFLCIFLVFTLCWLTNLIDGFCDLNLLWIDTNSPYIQEKKSNHFTDHFSIWMIEAVVNPLQGFLNCLVYGQAREMTSCCHKWNQQSCQALLWPDASRSDPSETFLINSHENLERRSLLQSRDSDGQTNRSASPFFEAKQTFIPRLLGEPRIT